MPLSMGSKQTFKALYLLSLSETHNCIALLYSTQESPVQFARLYISLPREGLQKAEEVFQMYKRLMSKTDKPVNWNCEDEYANNFPESTTALHTQTTGNLDKHDPN